MKRNFDLIRKILLYLEEKKTPDVEKSIEIEGHEKSEVMYHCTMLYDAGFLYGEPTKSSSSNRTITVLVFELTWEGHEFLSKIRDDTIWEKLKKTFSDKGSSICYHILNEIATKLAAEAIC